jgi:hypothetical protein
MYLYVCDTLYLSSRERLVPHTCCVCCGPGQICMATVHTLVLVSCVHWAGVKDINKTPRQQPARLSEAQDV